MNVIAEENAFPMGVSPQLTSLVNFIIVTSDLSVEELMTYTDTTQFTKPFIRHNVTAPNRPVIRVAKRPFDNLIQDNMISGWYC